MSNAKHTPGQWGIRSTESGTKAIFSGETGNWIAHTVKSTPMTQEANARLIASAPELLVALEQMLNLNSLGAYEQSAAISAARAAIAKARGEA